MSKSEFRVQMTADTAKITQDLKKLKEGLKGMEVPALDKAIQTLQKLQFKENRDPADKGQSIRLERHVKNILRDVNQELKVKQDFIKAELNDNKEKLKQANQEIQTETTKKNLLQDSLRILKERQKVRQLELAREAGARDFTTYRSSLSRFSRVPELEREVAGSREIIGKREDIKVIEQEEKELEKRVEQIKKKIEKNEELTNLQRELENTTKKRVELETRLRNLNLDTVEDELEYDQLVIGLGELESKERAGIKEQEKLRKAIGEDFQVNTALEEQNRIAQQISEKTRRRNELQKELVKIQEEYIGIGTTVDPGVLKKKEGQLASILLEQERGSRDSLAFKEIEGMREQVATKQAEIVSIDETILALRQEGFAREDNERKMRESINTANRLKQANSELNTASRQQLSVLTELRKEDQEYSRILDQRLRFFGEAGNYARNYLSGMVIIASVLGTIRKAVDYTKEFDKALNQIAIVSNMTMESVRELRREYIALAKDLSLSTTEVVKAATIFFQQGRSRSEVLDLVRATSVAAGLAGVSVEEAASRMTSALNSYQLAATEAMNVTDKFSSLASTTASSFDELTSAFTRVGASANLAGVEMDLMLAILASNIETLREAPESIGTALVNRASIQRWVDKHFSNCWKLLPSKVGDNQQPRL